MQPSNNANAIPDGTLPQSVDGNGTPRPLSPATTTSTPRPWTIDSLPPNLLEAIYGGSPPEPSPTETLVGNPIEYIRPKDPFGRLKLAKKYLCGKVNAVSRKAEKSLERKAKKVRKYKRQFTGAYDDQYEEFWDAWGPDWNQSARPDSFASTSRSPPRVVLSGMVMFVLEEPTDSPFRSDCEFTVQSFLSHLSSVQLFCLNGRSFTFRRAASFGYLPWSFMALYTYLISGILLAIALNYLIYVVLRAFCEWFLLIQRHRSLTGHMPQRTVKGSGKKVDGKALRNIISNLFNRRGVGLLVFIYLIIFTAPVPLRWNLYLLPCANLMALPLLRRYMPEGAQWLLGLTTDDPPMFSRLWYQGEAAKWARLAKERQEAEGSYAYWGPEMETGARLAGEERQTPEQDRLKRSGWRFWKAPKPEQLYVVEGKVTNGKEEKEKNKKEKEQRKMEKEEKKHDRC
ncbi:hypothetical protein I317_02401 [Kwoniella heveanensis CBS 569]|nr:hypothetical protein I317_02401 [Kwoniella heveanensis CBS 569]